MRKPCSRYGTPNISPRAGGFAGRGRARARRPAAGRRIVASGGAQGAALMARIALAMSGGVDSSTAAALLREQGHEVVGLTLQLWDYTAENLAAEGWKVSVVNARFVKPLDEEFLESLAGGNPVMTVEENVLAGRHEAGVVHGHQTGSRRRVMRVKRHDVRLTGAGHGAGQRRINLIGQSFCPLL